MALRLYEELKGRALAAEMAAAAPTTARALRDGVAVELDAYSVVVGDVVLMSAGDVIPGDVRVLEAHSLFVGCAPVSVSSSASGS
jgi:magnesium-transporting ATPase (P-type)